MNEKLQEKRIKKGISQKEFSKQVGISYNTYQSYELGRRKLEDASYRTVILISQALQCKPEDIL